MTVVLTIVFFVLLMALMTGGVVLCLHLWARRKFGVQSRTLLAAILGPGSMLVFPLLLILLENDAEWRDAGLGLGVAGLFMCVAIGWPSSAILTRKLEKSLLHDASIFG